jgi:hypothetical protein
VGIDRVEGQIGAGNYVDDFSARGRQLAVEAPVLSLSPFEVWGVVITEFLPAG